MASVVIAGDVSGTCTLQAANAAGTTVLTLPTTSGTLVATGGSPTFTTITTGLGNASAPAYSFTGDTNTGIFSPTADTIAFTEGGTESMRITSAGDVGIGTTSPAVKFEVSGTVVASGLSARITNTDTDASARAGIQFKTGASANVWQTFTRNNQLVSGINAVADYMTLDSSGITSGGYLAGAGYYRSSGMVNETITVTTGATVYSINKDTGAGASSSTSTYNITGVPNQDGAFLFLYVRCSNTAGGINTVVIVTVHGSAELFRNSVQNTTKTGSVMLARQNGSWYVVAPYHTGAAISI